MIAQRTLTELKKHANKATAGLSGEALQAVEATVANAEAGLAIVDELKAVGLADIRHEANEVTGNQRFVDPLILRLFVQYQKSIKLALITQDTQLAKQILTNARHLEAGATAPVIGFINECAKPDLPVGVLGNWAWRLTWPLYAGNSCARSNDRARSARRDQKPNQQTLALEPFKVVSTVYSGVNALITIENLPAERDTVFGDQSGALILVHKLSEGGEGAIYTTSLPDMICKIYFKPRLTEGRQAKLALMVTRRSPDRMICWPSELVRNQCGQFVGYLMPLAKGETLNLTVFKKPLLQAAFPHWGRQDLVQLAVTVLGLIKKLHDAKVLIGDINPNNFMVASEREVYLVDTDSFQIEGFPCPVGTPHFTPPELIGRSYGDFLRTVEHEIFAVATLLFMILFPSKPPYSGQGGGDVIESIQKRKFPYITEEGENSTRPFGPYRFIWSHLHVVLKQDFREIFSEGKRVPTPDPASGGGKVARPTSSYVDRFLFDLDTYWNAIQSGRYNNELFPTEYRFHVGERSVEIPCAEPGCVRFARLSEAHHQQLLKKGQTRFNCTFHFEIWRLRNQARSSKTTIRPLAGDSSPIRSCTPGHSRPPVNPPSGSNVLSGLGSWVRACRQISQITVEAKWMAARKLRAILS